MDELVCGGRVGGAASDVVAGAWYSRLVALVRRKEEVMCATVAVVVVMFGIWYVLGFWP